MEIDHIFIRVKRGAPEAKALRQFGLTEGSPNTHTGQGTANRRFFFDNAFIELLWLEDAEAASSDLTRPTLLLERLTPGADEVSPFGLCFRPSGREAKSAPFPMATRVSAYPAATICSLSSSRATSPNRRESAPRRPGSPELPRFAPPWRVRP